jgi:hypothetical protein
MKKTIIIWKEIRYYEFPDNAPTHSIEALQTYLGDHQEFPEDWDHFCVGIENLEGEIIE